MKPNPSKLGFHGHYYCCPGPGLACPDLKEARQQGTPSFLQRETLEITAAKVLISAKGRSYSNAVPSLDKFLSLTLAVLFNVMREAARVT